MILHYCPFLYFLWCITTSADLSIKSRYASIVYFNLTFEYLLFILYMVYIWYQWFRVIIHPHWQQKIFLKLQLYAIYQMADTRRISAIWCNLCKNAIIQTRQVISNTKHICLVFFYIFALSLCFFPTTQRLWIF